MIRTMDLLNNDWSRIEVENTIFDSQAFGGVVERMAENDFV